MGLTIKNWKEFQHYKDRNPPWIKVYRELLNDPEWYALDGYSAKVLVMLWLLASENTEGQLPDLPTIAWRLHIEEKRLKTIISKLKHWLNDDASTMLAPRYHDAIPETETERETKTEKENPIDWNIFTKFLESLKSNTAYTHINLEWELGKMDTWLALPAHKGRKKTQRFVLNWLNKIDPGQQTPTPKRKSTMRDFTNYPKGHPLTPETVHLETQNILNKPTGDDMPQDLSDGLGVHNRD